MCFQEAKMVRKLLPDYCVDNVRILDEKFYKSHGIEAIVFDIDNTLVAHTEMQPPEDVLNYFEFLKNIGIKYSIVSNNSMERVTSFCKDLGIPYYYKALKPRKKYLKKVLHDLGADANKSLLVGDQLFTDILGGNRMGMMSVLVTAVGEDETGFVSFKRRFEKRILKKYKASLKTYNS